MKLAGTCDFCGYIFEYGSAFSFVCVVVDKLEFLLAAGTCYRCMRKFTTFTITLLITYARYLNNTSTPVDVAIFSNTGHAN